MTTISATAGRTTATSPASALLPATRSVWWTLAQRRLALSARTPREVLAPLATPLLFALVIAPALATMIPTAGRGGVDYRSFVILGTVGLLIPLTCAFAGIGVIVDRTTGARRELLAAPIPRGAIVAGNLAVAILTSALQITALLVAGLARGAHFHATGTGFAWFVVAAVLFTVFAYAMAEILANRIPTQEEYIGLTPVVAIVPWFLAGSLFRITAMPVGMAAVARVLPTTHVLALLRYGLLDRRATALHDVWGVGGNTTAAALSLLVLAAWAGVMSSVSLRVFARSATL
jgi:ABC-type multidrug transport system permease subunit